MKNLKFDLVRGAGIALGTAAILLGTAAVLWGASPHEGNPGNDCTGASCVPLDDLSGGQGQGCETPAAIMNPHCIGYGDDGPGDDGPGDDGPGVGPDPEPDQPVRLRRGARLTPPQAALPQPVCTVEFGDAVRGATTARVVGVEVARVLATGQPWVPVIVADGKIAGIAARSDWVVVQVLPDGTVCAVHIGGVSG